MTHFTPRTHPSFIDALTAGQREGYLSALDLADRAQWEALDLFRKMDSWRESHQGYFPEPKETPPDESPLWEWALCLSEPAARCYKACRPLFSELTRLHQECGVMGWDGFYPTAVEAVHSFAVRTTNQMCLQVDPAWAEQIGRPRYYSLSCPLPGFFQSLLLEEFRLLSAARDIVGDVRGEPATAESDCIIYRGERCYELAGRAYAVSQEEHYVLSAFLKRPAMDGPQLAAAAGLKCGHETAKVLRGLKKKYDGVFAPAIVCPGLGGKGKGGYRVKIRQV